jgi:diamine N-acetyltransferase
MEYQIRKASEIDYVDVSKLVAQIHEIHVTARPDIYSSDPCPMGEEYFVELINDENSFILVAEDTGIDKVVAYMVIRINTAPHRKIHKQRKYINIDDLCVDETYRGRGLGKKLMNYIVEYAKEIEINCIELGVTEFNKEAVLFYESIGMKTRSRRMELFIEG